MKSLLKTLLLFILLITTWLGYRVYDNNRSDSLPDKAALQQSYEDGIDWLLANRDSILNDTNTTLWSHASQSIRNKQGPSSC